MPIKTMGIAWYSPETWQELSALPEAKIEKSYSDFLHTFERLVDRFTAQGLRVEKMPIDLSQMTAWCHKHGYEIDGAGRAAFGAVLALSEGLDVMTVPFKDDTRVVQ